MAVYAKFRALWKNKPDATTPITAEALNHFEDGLVAASTKAEAALPANDPKLSQAAAGTASVRKIGTAATDAAAGNHTHTAATVTATAIGPGTATTVQGILAELAARIAAVETP